MQLAFELSLKKWKLVFGRNGRMRMVFIDARALNLGYNRRLKNLRSALSRAVRSRFLQSMSVCYFLSSGLMHTKKLFELPYLRYMVD